MDRARVAGILDEIALLLELKGENPFKARAFSNAARTILSLNEDLAALVARGDLGKLRGIGQALEEKIGTLVTTGALPYHDELRREVPSGLLDVLGVPGLGPKKVRALHEQLGVDSLAALEYACRENRLASLTGFGERTQAKVLEGIEFLRRQQGRFLLSEATARAREILALVEALPGVSRAAIAGSVRRRCDVIANLDLVAAAADASSVAAAFASAPGVEGVVEAGSDQASVRMGGGFAVRLRVVSDASFACALHYFTGSRAHNTALAARASSDRFRMTLTPSGLARSAASAGGAGSVRCDTEEDLFRALDLPFIPPEIREGAGEIEAAESGALPRLVERRDLRGIFHVHSTWSDGRGSLEEMIRAAAEAGYAYVGISDHSRTAAYARGLKEPDVARQREEIDALRPKFPSTRILHGIESDILPDGSLDYPDAVLGAFDFVIGSVHSGFAMPLADMTRRVVRAVENPFLTILGHPTGRLLLGRKAFAVDLDAVIAAAARSGAAIEINANPHRLDLEPARARQARDAGVPVAINPDAHDVSGIGDVEYGIDTARRGWLRAEDILNARPWEEIAAARDRRRGRA
ncbi:MAG: DNA polymerase/3'-5' exonuclease PolX [Acidobacteria bacterium]|nr:DNA polymerase/3'-5' exonuclease PolX [Acidobacteriota bacterium]